MKNYAVKYLAMTLLLVGASIAELFAQEQEVIDLDLVYANRPELKTSAIRRILNKFSWTFTAGYEATMYEAGLQGLEIGLYGNDLVLYGGLAEDQKNHIIYKDWLSNPQSVTVPDAPQSFEGDPGSVQGTAGGPVFNGSLAYHYKKFRVGVGLGYSSQKVKDLKFENSIGVESVNFGQTPSFSLFRYYFLAGYEFFDYGGFHYVVEANLGGASYSGFDSDSFENSGVIEFALPIEREFSEYFRVVLRPAYQIKDASYSNQGSPTISPKLNAFNVTLGINIRIPEIPRCKTYRCNTQVKHRHGDKAYRGQPVFYPQNPKMGQIPKGAHGWKWRTGKPIHAPVKRKP
ncbi:hypothetical protein FUAX_13820 [Fulvitalea axinellae]|uniref:Outer membrane protein beta-barrel domain-containing protein n=1 Tax=Fulvitalea axinellae TaxID=1182444 RepID=A0AAU9DDI9_9BACT|nr:hypothetical protein FUAX_13820 [Fulvitalea axinellae]